MGEVVKWGPLLVVEWLDSCSLVGGVWHSTEDVAGIDLSRCRTVGWVLKETRDALILVPHISPHQVSGEMCIPKAAITRRRKVS